MSVLRRALGLEERSFTPPDSYAMGGWSQGMVWRGQQVGPPDTPEAAMRLTAVFACLRLLSENIATMPIDTYYRKEGARYAYRPRPDYLNFGEPGLSRIDYFSQVMLSLLTNGNAYVLTPRRADGSIVDLIVLDPNIVSVSREKGVVRYRLSGSSEPVDPVRDLMHIKGMCLPGHITGVSPIAYAAETAGVGLAAQRFGAGFFDNGAMPGIVIKTPGTMSEDGAKRWKETWDAGHAGPGNAGKTGVLTGGADIMKLTIAPEEAQFIQTRQFTVPDIARIFGVPPHLIADASNSTSWGTGLAEQNTAFGGLSLRPWVERIEEGHNRLLILDGLPTVFMKLNMDAVLRATLKDRYEAYAIGIENEFLVPNDARREEDMPPVAWGDVPPPTARRETLTPADSNVNPALGKPVPATAPATPATNGAHP